MKDNGRPKVIYFGDNRYEDYTQHRDKERRRLYLERHKGKEHWNDPLTPGFWSARLLWGDATSVVKNLRDIRHDFNI